MSEVIIDVRERDEYSIEHVEHSINVPLSVFAMVAPGVLNQLKDKKIMFMCFSGIRATQAKSLASNMGFNEEHEYTSYEGGLKKWKTDGNAVVQGNSNSSLPLQRQVQLIIGFLVMVFGGLGMWYEPWFSVAAAATGLGLFLAGATGYCLMAQIVALMPWNRGVNDNECTPCDGKGIGK